MCRRTARERRRFTRGISLGANIDHVATFRQARRTRYPDPFYAALLAEQSGADSITLHLREDRRHIQDRDVTLMRQLLKTRMNLEMAVTEEMIRIASGVKPQDCCLVPESRQEVTTEGGLESPARCDASARRARLRPPRGSGCRCSSIRSPPRSKPRYARVRPSSSCTRGHTPMHRARLAIELERVRSAAKLAASPRAHRECGSRPQLPQCRADRGDRRNRRTQHRPFDHRARPVRRSAEGGARHESIDARGAMIFGIGIDVLKVDIASSGCSRSTASDSSRIC